MKITVLKEPGKVHPEVNILCEEETPEVERLYRHISQFSKAVTALKDGREYQVPYNQICYVESVDGKTYIYTKEDVFLSQHSLTGLESVLSDGSFARISKACILNVQELWHVEPYENHRLRATLRNGEQQIVNRSYINGLKEKVKALR